MRLSSPLLVEEASGIVSQARQLGVPASIPIIGGNGFNSPALLANARRRCRGCCHGRRLECLIDIAVEQKICKGLHLPLSRVRPINSQPRPMPVCISLMRPSGRQERQRITRPFERP